MSEPEQAAAEGAPAQRAPQGPAAAHPPAGADGTAARPRPGDELELAVESLAFGGEGVARLGEGGYVVFVAGAIPGDRVRAVVYKRKRSHAHARAVEVLELCDLADKAGETAGRLSGGQQKLLELARVLIAEPKLILLDEPAAGVNPVLLETLVDRIVRLNQRGVTFLVIEHNIDLVLTVCRPIVVMAQGKLIYHGDAAGVRQDRRVLDAYLGDMPA